MKVERQLVMNHAFLVSSMKIHSAATDHGMGVGLHLHFEQD